MIETIEYVSPFRGPYIYMSSSVDSVKHVFSTRTSRKFFCLHSNGGLKRTQAAFSYEILYTVGVNCGNLKTDYLCATFIIMVILLFIDIWSFFVEVTADGEQRGRDSIPSLRLFRRTRARTRAAGAFEVGPPSVLPVIHGSLFGGHQLTSPCLLLSTS